MKNRPLQRLLDGRMMEEIEVDDEETVGLWRKAVQSYDDSQALRISREGAFKLLYDAGRQAASTFVAACGYRAKGTAGHHHSTFAAASALSSDPLSDFFTRMDLRRGKRHEVEYAARGEIDEETLEEMRELVTSLINETAVRLRELRPESKRRIKKVRR